MGFAENTEKHAKIYVPELGRRERLNTVATINTISTDTHTNFTVNCSYHSNYSINNMKE